MKTYLGIGVAFLLGMSGAMAEVVDFSDESRFPSGAPIVQSEQWNNGKAGDGFVGNGKKMLLLPDKKWAGGFITHAEAFAASKVGDSITVAIDFTFDQVKNKNDSELILVGLTNDNSRLLATYDRKGWGDYDSIGREGYPEGIVFEKKAIGFKGNAAVGTSDPLRLSMTLTRADADKWDMVVLLSNLNPQSDFSTRWETKDLAFAEGSVDQLFGVIQAGKADADAGVANRLVSRFEINNDSAPPAPPKTWQGVNFKKYILPMEPQGPLVDQGIWGASVLPRDPRNGLEDPTMKNWCYWDGSIVKDDDGKYHMYASRWTQAQPHGNGWKEHSKGMHAVSDHVMGPYQDMGLTWPHWKEGLGHNVIGLRMFAMRW